MGALDASLVFFLPLGIDFVVIVMTARKPELFWLYALLATAGSLTGAAGTYWIGKKAGEKGLTRFVSPRRLERVKAARQPRRATSMAGLALIPPPFPFTPFVLVSGALGHEPVGVLHARWRVRGCSASASKARWRTGMAARSCDG